MISKLYPQDRRLEPLGASREDIEDESTVPLIPKVQIEEERDLLQSSLFALTTQFAQVQFRLRQIINAPLEEKEELLKALEEFSFKGVPDLYQNEISNNAYETKLFDIIKSKREQQKQLISHLKSQICEIQNVKHRNLKSEQKFEKLAYKIRTMEGIEDQLRTQISDLERFIGYLKNIRIECNCKKRSNSFHNYIVDIIERSSYFFEVLAVIHLTWRRSCFRRNSKAFKKHHWADLRAQLELAIIKIKQLLTSKFINNHMLITAVRHDLATSIKNLIEHGTKSPKRRFSLLPYCFDCSKMQLTHSWDIILEYYNLKSGAAFNSSAIQKLSQSFDLEIGKTSPENSKKNLLYTIGNIIASHSKYKRSNDSRFKAFVCAALNANRLVSWLNLIFHCDDIVETHYYPWSYVANTKYEDSLESLDALSGCKFELPVDFDVRRFEIQDNVVLYS